MSGSPTESGRVTFLGHATLLIELAGRRLLTDPVLTNRLLHLVRRSSPVGIPPDPLDCVLISHLHHDHLHPGSLRRLPREATVVMPRGGGRLTERLGFEDVREAEAGDAIELDGLQIEAVPASHHGGRRPFGPRAEALGFIISGGGLRIYFAGDTDLFTAMDDIGDLDLALLPVWGWGTSIGAGHLDPVRAAEALQMLRPRVAIPIHWGTFLPIGALRSNRKLLVDPPREFARLAASKAPEVEVRILEPGEATVLS